MGLDGVLGQVEVTPDLGVALSLAHPGEHLQLALGELSTWRHAAGGVAAGEGGDRVAAVGVRANQLRLYDARKLRGMGEVGVGIGATHVVSDGERNMFVADTRGDAVIFVRTRPQFEVAARQALPNSSPYGLAYDRERDELWVTSTEQNRVTRFRGRTRADSFPTVRQPNSVEVDERTGRVFVGGRFEELQLIDPPQDEPAQGQDGGG